MVINANKIAIFRGFGVSLQSRGWVEWARGIPGDGGLSLKTTGAGDGGFISKTPGSPGAELETGSLILI